MNREIKQLQTDLHIKSKPRKKDHLISISQCEEQDFVEKKENSALIAIMLQIRHNSFAADEKKSLLTTASRYAPGLTNAARQRLGGGNKNYDRLALFADTSENGRCFAIIFKNSAVAAKFFDHCIRSQEGVGHAFFLDEPSPVTSTLGSTPSVPIIESVLKTIPINNPINTLIPHVPLETPNMGCTRYFSSHNVTDIKFLNAQFVDSICLGYFCDRQLCVDNLTTPTNAKCGCFYQDRSTAPTIIQVDIVLPCPVSFDQTGKTYITNFRSYNTSLLFIKKETLKIVENDNSDHLDLLRLTIKNIVKYVNDNGGWSYIGWLRTGIVHDISETQTAQAENLASTSQTPHLSYLYPTNKSCISETHEIYKRQIMTLSALQNNDENNHSIEEVH